MNLYVRLNVVCAAIMENAEIMKYINNKTSPAPPYQGGETALVSCRNSTSANRQKSKVKLVQGGS